MFPGNGRIVAAWFPTAERGRASALFNAAQYFSLVFFAPIMGWIVHLWGWKQCFWFAGAVGLVLGVFWFRVIHGVKSHPRISQPEIDLIEQGGGLATLDAAGRRTRQHPHLVRRALAAQQAHARRHLHRPVLHHHAHLVLPHLVSRLPQPRPPHPHRQGRIPRRTPRPLRFHRRHPRRCRLRRTPPRRPQPELRAQTPHRRRHARLL